MSKNIHLLQNYLSLNKRAYQIPKIYKLKWIKFFTQNWILNNDNNNNLNNNKDNNNNNDNNNVNWIFKKQKELYSLEYLILKNVNQMLL